MRRTKTLVCAVLCLATVVPVVAEQASAPRALAPEIRVAGVSILDATDGNNDGGLHPGETASLRIWLSNQGGALAQFVTGELEERVDHPDVEILRKSAFWPDLPGSGDGAFNLVPDFSIRVAETRPCGWIVPLRLTIRAMDGYVVTRDIDLELTSGEPDPDAPTRGQPAIRGAGATDLFGSDLAVGDYNGDGIDDLFVGSQRSVGDPADPQTNSGEVRVLHGGILRVDSTVDVEPGQRIIRGGDPNDFLGREFAVGDVNGNGRDDLVIAVEDAVDIGAVRVSFGSTATTPVDIGLCCATGIITGYTTQDGFGASVAVGDYDGDGREDILIGADNLHGEFGSISNAGAAFLVTRAVDVNQSVATANGVIKFWGVETGRFIGARSAMGDFNGDGLQDAVLAGSPDVAWVAYGTRTPQPEYDLVAGQSGIDRLSFEGSSCRSLATGDLNGDGFDDLAIGLSGRAFVVYGAPEGVGSRAVNGRDPSITILTGHPLGNYSLGGTTGTDGNRGLAIGDHDGDGYDDLLIGESRRDLVAAEDGAAYLLYGGPGGIASTDFTQEGYGVRRFNGTGGKQFGSAVALGDFDGDGFDDAAISRLERNSPYDEGEVNYYPGGPRTTARWDADTYAFIDATAGAEVPLGCDDCGTDISLGFDFVFDNRSYDTVTVSSNGYLTFGGDATASLGFCPGNTAPPNATIAVFWDDLNLEDRGAVYAITEGIAPNRRTTISWVDVPHWPDDGDATFEITLFESSNRIVMQYLDTEFGGNSPASYGQTAVAGVEGTTGLYGAQFNCRDGRLGADMAIAYRWFSSPTVVYSEDFESGAGGYTATGLWNLNAEPTCSPAAVSGSSAFYYGQQAFCNYDTGAGNLGDLTSPTIPSLPQDAALEFWSRLRKESAPYDLSFVRAQGTTPGYIDLAQIDTSSASWIWAQTYPSVGVNTPGGVFQRLDLSRFTGEDVNLRFSFEATDEIGNETLGWMIDDVTIRACPVYSTPAASGAAAQALATASAPAICEDEAGRVDAVGSYCTACATGLTYQWSRDGAPIGGAIDPAYDIPAGEAPGSYGYSVAIGCPGQPVCDGQSTSSTVQVVGRPGDPGPTLVAGPDTDPLDVLWNWNDVANAGDYVLRSDTSPVDRTGGFGLEEGIATTGTTGIATPRAGETRYYLVVARNPVCGEGGR